MGKRYVSALLIIGLAFSLIGVPFLISGAVCWYSLGDTEAWMVGPVHMLLGCVFSGIGIGFLAVLARRRRRAKKLLEGGRYLWGEITALEPDIRIRINNRHPYRVLVRSTDASGRTANRFSASTMALRGREDLVGRYVKVYIGENPDKDYHVDIGSLL